MSANTQTRSDNCRGSCLHVGVLTFQTRLTTRAVSRETQWVTATVCQTFDGAVWAISWSPSLCATGRPVPLDGDRGVSRSIEPLRRAELSPHWIEARDVKDRLCHCRVVAVWMHRRGLYEKLLWRDCEMWICLAGDFELMGIAARESQSPCARALSSSRAISCRASLSVSLPGLAVSSTGAPSVVSTESERWTRGSGAEGFAATVPVNTRPAARPLRAV